MSGDPVMTRQMAAESMVKAGVSVVDTGKTTDKGKPVFAVRPQQTAGTPAPSQQLQQG